MTAIIPWPELFWICTLTAIVIGVPLAVSWWMNRVMEDAIGPTKSGDCEQ